MKKITFTKVILLLAIALFAVDTQAQLREVKLYCSDDWTIDNGREDGGVEGTNAVCNFDEGIGDIPAAIGNGLQEPWIKWDLSSIELAAGEEIIGAEVMLRAGGNYQDQGFEAIVLADKYDDWIETDFSWNKAKTLGDFIAEGGDTVAVMEIAHGLGYFVPGENTVSDKFSVLESVKAEYAGNKKFTIRLKPYYDVFDITLADDKKWLGYYSRQVYPSWSEDKVMDADGIEISAWSPYIKLKIAKPAEIFSNADLEFGNINNYDVIPTDKWYAVEDDAGEGRLLMLRNASQNPDSIGASAIYKPKTDYTDFELTLDARSNDALAEMKTNVSIIFDYIDELNYSCFTFYGVPESGADKLNGVYNVVEGMRTAVGETIGGFAIVDDEYHTYSVKREGSVVTASVDGTVFHTVDDASLSGAGGSLGFGSGKFLVNFDNVREKATTTSAIADRGARLNLEIYPNPAKNSVELISDKLINSVEIFDVAGRSTLKRENVNSRKTTLNLSGLERGVYFIITKSNGAISTSKLLKE